MTGEDGPERDRSGDLARNEGTTEIDESTSSDAETTARIERLESRIEQQREAMDRQRERITELETERSTAGFGGLQCSRRTALTAGGVLGLFGLGAGTASGAPQGQVGTESNPIRELHAVDVHCDGDINAAGTKHFVETVETDAGELGVAYSALEAPTARTEVSGVATIEDGSVSVELPDHFAWVTDADEDLVVQVTAHAAEEVSPQVTERSTARIRIEDAGDGLGSYDVSYTVKGTRAGFAEKEVVSDPSDRR